ncbi:MAG: preprotein translocase subunit SecE [Deltaproteobacteria bacterium]|nr:preprotein translocase subunit SecE [Deltaproteobacteria bacterium]
MSQARMVNMSFMAAALLLWVVSASFFAGTFDLLRPEWDLALIGNEFRLSNLLGILVGVGGGIYLWRHAQLYQLANEVAAEVRKVTWPNQEETRVSTVVVMVTTIIIAIALWAFDIAFSALTKIFYDI